MMPGAQFLILGSRVRIAPGHAYSTYRFTFVLRGVCCYQTATIRLGGAAASAEQSLRVGESRIRRTRRPWIATSYSSGRRSASASAERRAGVSVLRVAARSTRRALTPWPCGFRSPTSRRLANAASRRSSLGNYAWGSGEAMQHWHAVLSGGSFTVRARPQEPQGASVASYSETRRQ